jgi:hypothetical protein
MWSFFKSFSILFSYGFPFVTFQIRIKLLACELTDLVTFGWASCLELTDLLLDVAVFSAIMSCSVIVVGCVSVPVGPYLIPLSSSRNLLVSPAHS